MGGRIDRNEGERYELKRCSLGKESGLRDSLLQVPANFDSFTMQQKSRLFSKAFP